MLKSKLIFLLQTGPGSLVSLGHHSMIYPAWNPEIRPPSCAPTHCSSLSFRFSPHQWDLVAVVLVFQSVAFPMYRAQHITLPLLPLFLIRRINTALFNIPSHPSSLYCLPRHIPAIPGSGSPARSAMPGRPSPSCVCCTSWPTCLPIYPVPAPIVIQTARSFSLGERVSGQWDFHLTSSSQHSSPCPPPTNAWRMKALGGREYIDLWWKSWRTLNMEKLTWIS